MVFSGHSGRIDPPFTLSSDNGQGYVLHRFAPQILLDIVIIIARGRPISTIGRQFLVHITAKMTKMAVADI